MKKLWQEHSEVTLLKTNHIAERYGRLDKTVLEPIQKRYREITADEITQALSLGSANARMIADSTLKKVKRAMGLFTFD